ncbi:MAG: CRISPR-associated endonuclease Cas1 [Bacteroidota bacterium]|nr:CRISPR-associated endonuclease Cas1 [Bacteroidota bacterium]
MHLVINTYGTFLAKENGLFKVVGKDLQKKLNPTDIKTISISKGALISSDAALLAIENDIDVFFIDGLGRPLGRIWSNKFGSVTTIRRNQIDFTFSAQAVDWIKKVLIEKIDNQAALLLAQQSLDSVTDNKIRGYINKLNDYKTKISSKKGRIISDVAQTLRGWEGAASKNYFSALNLIIPKQYKFLSRSQHPAKDIFNALLNYGYGVLYGKIEAELIRAGIDPYIGIFHREDYNRPVLTFDVIEKYRVWVDYVVLNLVNYEAIDEDCYSVKEDGSFWLENLGKRILVQSINDYFEEAVKFKKEKHSRTAEIAEYSRKLAKKFLYFSAIDDLGR